MLQATCILFFHLLNQLQKQQQQETARQIKRDTSQ